MRLDPSGFHGGRVWCVSEGFDPRRLRVYTERDEAVADVARGGGQIFRFNHYEPGMTLATNLRDLEAEREARHRDRRGPGEP
jgi:hypothetical protein